MTEVGLTALSVEISTKCSGAEFAGKLRQDSGCARTLFLIASAGFVSISGTCLCAAA